MNNMFFSSFVYAHNYIVCTVLYFKNKILINLKSRNITKSLERKAHLKSSISFN